MSHGRRIVFSENCNAAAQKVGGYEKIDYSLLPVFEALERNHYGFPLVESDWFSCRFIVTKPFLSAPPLVWLFYVEPSGTVVLDYVEEFEGY